MGRGGSQRGLSTAASSPSIGLPSGLPADFEINRPQRGSRDGYFYLWLELNKQYGEITNSMQGGRYDPRIYRKVRHMIATITDDSLRLYAWNLLDGTLNQIKKDTHLMTVEQKNDAIMDLCDVILGEVWSFYDQFMGVTHRLRVGTATPPDSKENDIDVGVIESPVGTPESTEVVEELI